ncbi:MAG: chorismate-binding protein [Myxococcota bacterium]
MVTTAQGPWQEPQCLDPRDVFVDNVRRAKEHILAGDIIQVVLSRRFVLPPIADPFDIYRGLRTINPSPYLFFFRTPQVQLAGASPEVMIRVKQGQVTVRPIAGTRPRGEKPQLRTSSSPRIFLDVKERAEHIMLVDLGRNELATSANREPSRCLN